MLMSKIRRTFLIGAAFACSFLAINPQTSCGQVLFNGGEFHGNTGSMSKHDVYIPANNGVFDGVDMALQAPGYYMRLQVGTYPNNNVIEAACESTAWQFEGDHVGHARLDFAFSLNQGYSYTASASSTPSGQHFVLPASMSASGGILGSGPHRVNASADGSQTGLAFQLNLTPISDAQYKSAQDDLLRNSVKTNVSGRTMTATFTPQIAGMTIAEAKELLGIKEFNWIQHITTPSYITTTRVSKTEPHVIFGTEGATYIDPIVSTSAEYHQTSTNKPGFLSEIKQLGTALPADDYVFYWNEGTEIASRTGIYSLGFEDAPSIVDGFLKPGDFRHFETQLVGVKDDGSLVTWSGLGTNFSWDSDATHIDPTITYNKAVDDGTLPTLVSGGIFNVQMDVVPEPATVSLFALVAPALLMGGRKRLKQRA